MPRRPCFPSHPGRFAALVVVSLSAVTAPAVAQVSVTLHGGIHAGRPEAAQRAADQSDQRVSGRGGAGEATTAGARLGMALTQRWTLDAGAAWSRSTSWEGRVSRPLPAFESHTVFASMTLQSLLSDPDSRIGLVAGAGPALIFHGASDPALPARHTDLGAVLMLGTVMRLDSRFSVRLDAQQYFFSSNFSQPYTPMLGGTPAQPRGSRFRHDFVMLAGLSWHSR
jgi:Outer membrane protein beta-barrel domain